jgi:hypothetical protein
MIHIAMHRKWLAFIETVYGRCGSVDEVFDIVMPAGLEDINKTLDIAVDIGLRILNAVADTSLGGEMDKNIGFEIFD